jgi:hypothetical protein
VKRSGSRSRVKVSADGRGVVSHAGVALLRELAVETGLASAVTGALLDTYRGVPVHAPGQVFADLAVAIADGADAVTGRRTLPGRTVPSLPSAGMIRQTGRALVTWRVCRCLPGCRRR